MNIKKIIHTNKKNIINIIAFIILVVLGAYIFYLRFPNNFNQPNFYAEDGYIFAHNLINKGFINSIFEIFNGYYLWGVYLLGEIGIIVNSILFKGNLLYLPQSFALVSYFFLSLCVTLPLFLFRKIIGSLPLFLLISFSLFLPMPGSDYAIIGTISNLKFLFLYLAFLLIIYRNVAGRNIKKIILIDFIILICGFTNINVYLLIPFGLYHYINKYSISGCKKIFKDITFISYVTLGLLLLLQLVVIKINGIPKLVGYLDSPFNFARAIEIFIYRPFVFVCTEPILKNLNNLSTLLITGILIILIVIYNQRKNIWIYLMGGVAIFFPGIIFAINRTGISDHFFGYLSSGPDQFFYTQNLITLFVLTILLGDVWHYYSENKKIKYLTIIPIILFFPIYVLHSGSFGGNNFMEKNVGNVFINAKNACNTQRGLNIQFSVYPEKKVPKMILERDSVCSDDM